jgi:2-dehydropantoate 2-reductase
MGRMRVLIVGAGAVGQVYGYHLQRGGAEVAWFVKEVHAAVARQGFLLYPLNRARTRRATPPLERLSGCAVLTSPDEVRRAGPFDQVWLAISAPALRGAWLGPLLAAAGDATVVLLTPGIEDRALVVSHVPASRLVIGIIAFVAYPAPLAGETRFPEPGLAYWLPPLLASPFAGPPAARRAVVRALKKGGLPAVALPARDRSGRAGAFGVALSMPLLMALEAADWSFARLRKSRELLDLWALATRQALGAAAAHTGLRPPPVRLAVSTLGPRWLLPLSRGVTPFPLETYLAYHFTKVGDQTRHYLRELIAWGREAGVPVDAIESLLARA